MVKVKIPLTVLFCFLMGNGFLSAEDKNTKANVESFSVPYSLGVISESYKGVKPDFLICLRDRHIDPTAQINISKIIEFINKTYGTKLLCVEGASNKLDMSYYDQFPDDKIKNDVSCYFVKKAFFSGSEHYRITHKNANMDLIGVEDKDIYLKHLDVFINNQRNGKSKISSYVDSLKNALEQLEAKDYPGSLKEFKKYESSYYKKELKLQDYIAFLDVASKKAGVNLNGYENINKFKLLIEKEKAIDFVKADSEKELFLSQLNKSPNQKAFKQLLERNFQQKLRKIPEEKFFESLYMFYISAIFLKDNIQVNLDNTRELSKYIDYVFLANSVNFQSLLYEVEELSSSIKNRLCSTQQQQTIAGYGSALRILSQLCEFKLTKQDLAYIDKNSYLFNISAMNSFIQKLCLQYNIKNNLSNYSIDDIEKAINNNINFYVLALNRDNALIDNTLKAINNNNDNHAILITGGFHTDGITSILKEKGISYVVVSPNLDDKSFDDLYLERMRGSLPALDKMADFFKQTLSAPLITGGLGSAEKVNYIRMAFAILVGYGRAEAKIKAENPLWAPVTETELAAILKDVNEAIGQKGFLNMDEMEEIVHQHVIDARMKNFVPIDQAHKDKLDKAIDDLEKKYGDRGKLVAEGLRQLRNENKIYVVDGLPSGINGHAGKQGIYIKNGNVTVDDIIHEALAYFFEIKHDDIIDIQINESIPSQYVFNPIPQRADNANRDFAAGGAVSVDSVIQQINSLVANNRVLDALKLANAVLDSIGRKIDRGELAPAISFIALFRSQVPEIVRVAVQKRFIELQIRQINARSQENNINRIYITSPEANLYDTLQMIESQYKELSNNIDLNNILVVNQALQRIQALTDNLQAVSGQLKDKPQIIKAFNILNDLAQMQINLLSRLQQLAKEPVNNVEPKALNTGLTKIEKALKDLLDEISKLKDINAYNKLAAFRQELAPQLKGLPIESLEQMYNMLSKAYEPFIFLDKANNAVKAILLELNALMRDIQNNVDKNKAEIINNSLYINEELGYFNILIDKSGDSADSLQRLKDYTANVLPYLINALTNDDITKLINSIINKITAFQGLTVMDLNLMIAQQNELNSILAILAMRQSAEKKTENQIDAKPAVQDGTADKTSRTSESGLTKDEIMLINAFIHAIGGNIPKALDVLNGKEKGDMISPAAALMFLEELENFNNFKRTDKTPKNETPFAVAQNRLIFELAKSNQNLYKHFFGGAETSIIKKFKNQNAIDHLNALALYAVSKNNAKEIAGYNPLSNENRNNDIPVIVDLRGKIIAVGITATEKPEFKSMLDNKTAYLVVFNNTNRAEKKYLLPKVYRSNLPSSILNAAIRIEDQLNEFVTRQELRANLTEPKPQQTNAGTQIDDTGKPVNPEAALINILSKQAQNKIDLLRALESYMNNQLPALLSGINQQEALNLYNKLEQYYSWIDSWASIDTADSGHEVSKIRILINDLMIRIIDKMDPMDARNLRQYEGYIMGELDRFNILLDALTLYDNRALLNLQVYLKNELPYLLRALKPESIAELAQLINSKLASLRTFQNQKGTLVDELRKVLSAIIAMMPIAEPKTQTTKTTAPETPAKGAPPVNPVNTGAKAKDNGKVDINRLSKEEIYLLKALYYMNNGNPGEALKALRGNAKGYDNIPDEIIAMFLEAVKSDKWLSNDPNLELSDPERVLMWLKNSTKSSDKELYDKFFGDADSSIINKLKSEKSLAILRGSATKDAAAEIIEYNIRKILFDPAFFQQNYGESIGGNAGEGYTAINMIQDKSGRIIAIGNIQNLSEDIKQMIEKGEAYQIGFRVNMRMPGQAEKHKKYVMYDISGPFGKEAPPEILGLFQVIEDRLNKMEEEDGGLIEAIMRYQQDQTAQQPQPARQNPPDQNRREPILRESSKGTRVIAIGDIHGDLEGLKEMLRHAGIINENDVWIAENVILIQNGDLIDRGPASREVFAFLRKLQEMAEQKNSKVIRIAGNHELMLIRGDIRYANFPNPHGLAKEIRQEIIDGKIQAAYFINGRLFVHGGLRSKQREWVKQQIVQKLEISISEVTDTMIADEINTIFRNDIIKLEQEMAKKVKELGLSEANEYQAVFDVEQEVFAGPLYEIPARRIRVNDISGTELPQYKNNVGGIFWADYSDLLNSGGAGEIKQVVGHSPQGKPGAEIRYSPNMSKINIDVGVFRGYGGNRGYLIIEEGGAVIKAVAKRQVGKDRWEWAEDVIADYRSAAMKDIGDEDAVQVEASKKNEWRQTAENSPVVTKYVKGEKIEAKIIIDTNIPEGIEAYHLYDNSNNLIIVLRANPDESPVAMEGLYHEAREAYWVQLFRGQNPDMNGNQLEDALRNAHRLAAAEQAIAFGSGTLSPFHKQQIEKLKAMPQDAQVRFLNADRSSHHKLIEEFLGPDKRAQIEQYEMNLRMELMNTILGASNADRVKEFLNTLGFSEDMALRYGFINVIVNTILGTENSSLIKINLPFNQLIALSDLAYSQDLASLIADLADGFKIDKEDAKAQQLFVVANNFLKGINNESAQSKNVDKLKQVYSIIESSL